jgi:hypothetical protein
MYKQAWEYAKYEIRIQDTAMEAIQCDRIIAVSVPSEALIGGELWHKNAPHTNAENNEGIEIVALFDSVHSSDDKTKNFRT